jgi:hypothetical protein
MNILVSVARGLAFTAEIHTIAPGSAFLKTDRELKFRDAITLEIANQKLRGEVVYVSGAPTPGIGVVFEAPPEVRGAITAIAEAVGRERSNAKPPPEPAIEPPKEKGKGKATLDDLNADLAAYLYDLPATSEAGEAEPAAAVDKQITSTARPPSSGAIAPVRRPASSDALAPVQRPSSSPTVAPLQPLPRAASAALFPDTPTGEASLGSNPALVAIAAPEASLEDLALAPSLMEVGEGDRLLLGGRLDAYAAAMTLLAGRPLIARTSIVPQRVTFSYDSVTIELSVAALGGGLIALAARDRSQVEQAVRTYKFRESQDLPRSPAAPKREPKPSEVPHLGADGKVVKFQSHEHYVVQHKANISQGAIVVRAQPIAIGTVRELILEIPTVQEPVQIEATVSFLQDNLVGFTINAFAMIKEQLARFIGPAARQPSLPLSGPSPIAAEPREPTSTQASIKFKGPLMRPADLRVIYDFAATKPSTIDACGGWIARVLDLLFRTVDKSVISFQHGDKKLTLWIQGGRVSFTKLEPPSEINFLGHKLVAEKRINRRTLDQALERQRATKEPIGRTLVAMGAILPGHLHASLRAQTMDRVLAVREWEEGQIDVSAWTEPPISGDLVASQGTTIVAALLRDELRDTHVSVIDKLFAPWMDRRVKLDTTRLDAMFQLSQKERRSLEIASEAGCELRAFTATTGLNLQTSYRLILFCRALGALDLVGGGAPVGRSPSVRGPRS